MNWAPAYLRSFLHLVEWILATMGLISTIILACIVADWIGHYGWNYPWYAGPIMLAMLAGSVRLKRLAKLGRNAILL